MLCGPPTFSTRNTLSFLCVMLQKTLHNAFIDICKVVFVSFSFFPFLYTYKLIGLMANNISVSEIFSKNFLVIIIKSKF